MASASATAGWRLDSSAKRSAGLHRRAAGAVREEGALAHHRSRADDGQAQALLLVFVVHAEAAAFEQVERAVRRALREEHLPGRKTQRQQVVRQQFPLVRSQHVVHAVLGRRLRDGLHQAAQIDLGGGGRGGGGDGVHRARR
jgi:hypothetical protein